MADICDQADVAIESNMQRALREAELSPKGPAAVGRCHACGHPLEQGRAFCDAECREDWEYVEAAKRRNGGR